jgi:hypothetical protein
MANERLAEFKNDKTKVNLKIYSNKLYTRDIVHFDNYYVEQNTHSNVVERFE